MQTELSCNVPTDRSFLSMVGNNTFMDGDDFRQDGWVYRIRHPYNDDPTYSYGFNWSEEPERPINLEAGQRFYDVEQQSQTVVKRSSVLCAAFEKAIWHWFYEQKKNLPKPAPGKSLKLKINGRSYWFQGEWEGRSYQWRRLHWPEEELIQVNIVKRE